MTLDCIFCRIVKREIPSKIVHEDDRCIAFQDVNPQAPTHILIVPKRHVSKLADTRSEDAVLLGHLLGTARDIASKTGLSDYRIVLNNGTGAGQTVWHLHYHLLAGRSFSWPPG